MASDSVLVVNAGSSSLKLRLLGPGDEILDREDMDADEMPGEWPDAAVAGHRIVHGGLEFRDSVVVDDDVAARLDLVSELAHLHNPPALRALEALRGARPDMVQVACFDTAFHATLPDAAAVYAVPWDWTARLGVRRFGFHGLSHRWAARRAAELLGHDPDGLRLVTCHLGAGSSLAAVADGRAVDTTMGFTPLEGIVMATRSGSVDPGLLLYVQEQDGLTPWQVRAALERESGLLSLSGMSGDMREVLEAAAAGHQRAALALDVYLHRLRAAVAAMAAAMDGLDAVVFTGGVGERSAEVRARACAGLGFLGVALDGDANATAAGDAVVSPDGSVLVVASREDLVIAAEARRLVAGQ